MKRWTMSLMMLGGALVLAGAAWAEDPTLRWKDVVGLVQAGNVVGVGSGQVVGGGQPWTTSGGTAGVNLATGRLDFVVKGLVLAGGNTIGTPGAITQVKGTLVCDTNGSASGGNAVLVDTPAVDLDAEGAARFSGVVTIPSACLEPDVAFLVRIAAPAAVAGRWIANGAVLVR